jgi:pantoate--beta-alanine ligase
MRIINNAKDLAEAVSTARQHGNQIAFVPTMGALHDGHISLVELAKQNAEFVVVSIFVNPLQFSANEDFDKYPRNLQADAEKLAAVGVDIVFAPTVDEVYPNGDAITQHAGPIGKTFEGEIRPEHFDGMLTVVARLFDIVQPDAAVFGKKDAQQLFLIQRMVENSNHRWNNLKIIAAPIIREESGLAMSSRNQYLAQEERELASTIHAAILSAKEGVASERLRAVEANLSPAIRLDYVALVNPNSFEPIDDSFSGQALLLIAARVGSTRLLDNLSITI